MDSLFTLSDFTAWVILPLLVFFARILDVSLGTMRIIFTSRGKRHLAPLLGFVEVFIWVVVISQIVQNLSNIAGYFAYAAGFAAGNYVGIFIEEKLALGTLVIRAILSETSDDLIDRLRASGYGVTSFLAQGALGPVTVLYTVFRRKELNEVVDIISQVNPKAFYTVEEIRSAREGIFHPAKSAHPGSRLSIPGIRKGK
jgi:uncharacterized protein YebE (UPF0316 family)